MAKYFDDAAGPADWDWFRSDTPMQPTEPICADDIDLRLGWIPLAKALDVIGGEAWQELSQAILRKRLSAQCLADGVTTDVDHQWLDFVLFEKPDKTRSALWFDQKKAARKGVQVPHRAEAIVVLLEQCMELWPGRTWAQPVERLPTGMTGRPSKGKHPDALGDVTVEGEGPKQRKSPGPQKGSLDRFAASDRELYPAFKALINPSAPAVKMSRTAASLKLPLKGDGTPESRAKRFRDRYRRDHERN
jgi:hypothetical protein